MPRNEPSVGRCGSVYVPPGLVCVRTGDDQRGDYSAGYELTRLVSRPERAHGDKGGQGTSGCKTRNEIRTGQLGKDCSMIDDLIVLLAPSSCIGDLSFGSDQEARQCHDII